MDKTERDLKIKSVIKSNLVSYGILKEDIEIISNNIYLDISDVLDGLCIETNKPIGI